MPIKAEPGQLERYDCEYKRNGTVNLFIFLDAHRPWRKVKVTDSRAAVDFAACMRELADVHFPKAERIRVVLDNLSTHTAGALYQAFPPGEARRLLRRLEFHYVPKHASWLNIASSPKSRPGSASAILPAPASSGCSQPIKHAPKWAEPIQTSRPKSQNHCDEVLVVREKIEVRIARLSVGARRVNDTESNREQTRIERSIAAGRQAHGRVRYLR